MYDHNGFAVNWEVTSLLEENGFTDLWRQLYPDPIKNPCITYPSDVPSLPAKKICWAPKADDRDRIDFIFGSNGIKPLEGVIVGPTASMCRSKRVVENHADSIIPPLGTWFTDHKGVLVHFVWF